MTHHVTPFQTIIHAEGLLSAWNKVLRNAGAPGGDGETVGHFQNRHLGALRHLYTDLCEGTYAPGPVRHLKIPKPSGGVRPLSIPCVIDRVAQTAVAQHLTQVLEPEFEDSSFGYRPGRSVNMAAMRIGVLRDQGYVWVVDGDIERYFENVPHDKLMDKLARYEPNAQVLALVRLWLKSGDPDGTGLLQGSPLSPILSNLYLDDIDEQIEASGVRLVRFADDFVLLCKREADAEAAKARIADLLEQHGLKLNREKTKIVPFDRGFKFLGKLFVRTLMIDAPERSDQSRPPPLPPRSPTDAPLADVALAEDTLAPNASSSPEIRNPEIDNPKINTPGLDENEPALEAWRLEAREIHRAPLVRPLHVNTAGTLLDVRNQSFVAKTGEEEREIMATAPGRVGRIEIGPYARISEDAVRQAIAWDIPLHFSDGWGRTLARLERDPGARYDRHLAQAHCALDFERRLALACILVDGRIRTQHALLKRLNRKRKREDVDDAAVFLKRVRLKLKNAQTIPYAMGVEGEAAAKFWPALGKCLEHDWKFRTRDRRCGKTPVNLILDWLCSLVRRELDVLVRRWDLHPGFGVLHETRAGHDALTSDLMEEFRAPLVESLCVYVFNNEILQRHHFSTELNPQSGQKHWRISPDGRAAMLRAWERHLARPVVSPASGEKRTWRGVIDDQIGLYVEHIEGRATYLPYRLDY